VTTLARLHDRCAWRTPTQTIILIAAALATAAAQPPAAPTGWVRDSTGAPIADADVSVPSMRVLAHTDSTGAFTLRGVGAGAVTINVRRLGFEPRSLSVEIRSAPTAKDSIVVTLRAIPQLLDSMRIGSGRVHQDFLIEEFYRRQARGPGLFITRADIDLRRPTRLSDMARQFPGIRVVGRPGGLMGIRFPSTSMARRDCPPQYWVDGRRVMNFELDELPPSDIEGIELYSGPSSTPMQFLSNEDKTCGTVVIWSRPPG
jgi:carboxypeptidase family protein/TonB-dependent receptor-like protein